MISRRYALEHVGRGIGLLPFAFLPIIILKSHVTSGNTKFRAVSCVTPQITKHDQLTIAKKSGYVPFSSNVDGMATVNAAFPSGRTISYDAFAIAFGPDFWTKSDSFSTESPAIDLTISFLGGKKEQHDLVKMHAPSWTGPGRANVKFHFRSDDAGLIRISFNKNGGNWSKIGRQALKTQDSAPTMNLADADPAVCSPEEIRSIVLHEFGHALGLRHEHQHPEAGIPWSKPAATNYFMARGLLEPEINEQIFKTYRVTYAKRTEQVDLKSIMIYPIPAEITDGIFEVKLNSDLSNNDKLFVERYYK